MNSNLMALWMLACALGFSAVHGQQAKSAAENAAQFRMIPVFDKSTAGEPIITPNGEIIYELTGRGVPGTSDRHSIAYVILPPGMSTPNHYHPEDEESYYILKGNGHMNVGGQDFEVGAGQAVYIAPGKNHKLTTLGGEKMEFIAISVPAWHADGTVLIEE